MGVINDAKCDAITALVGDAVWIVPCDDDPGTTGANIVAGIDPVETNWGTATGAGIMNGTQCVYEGAPAAAYSHYAAFEDEAMTQYRFGQELDPPITFLGVGTLYINPKAVYSG